MEKVTDATFEQEVMQSDQLVAIDFGATWCGPCKKLHPIMDKFAEEFAGKAKILEVDIGEAPQVAQKYRVLSVPQVLFFKGGEVVDAVIGFDRSTKGKIEELFNKHLS